MDCIETYTPLGFAEVVALQTERIQLVTDMVRAKGAYRRWLAAEIGLLDDRLAEERRQRFNRVLGRTANV